MSALASASPQLADVCVNPACEAAIAQGEIRVLESDWQHIRDQFTQQEKDAIRDRILIGVLSKDRVRIGWYLALERLDPRLVRKIVYALQAAGGLRELGE